MKRVLFAVFLFCAVLSSKAAVVDTVSVYSRSMDKSVKAVVVTPDGDKVSVYPVVYLLHGYSGNEKDWIHSKAGLPDLSDHYQVIIVCPDGRNSWYWDSPVNLSYKYETFISKELPAYVDGHYSTIKSNKGRAITGLSMGGHGALWNAFRHKDVFGAAGSMSGGVDIRPFPNNWDMKNLLGAYESNKTVWDNHTVINLVADLIDGEQAIIFDCGTDDFFFEVNNNLHQALMDKKIKHDYIVRPGGHNWPYWVNAIKYQLLFFTEYFNRFPADK